MVIESSWGQGEEIVSGRVTPDTFVLDKESGRALERKVADKKRMKIPSLDSGGLEEFNVPRAMRKKPSLEDVRAKAALVAFATARGRTIPTLKISNGR